MPKDTSTAAARERTVVPVTGDLNHATVPRLVERLRGAIASGPPEVVLDLGSCPFVDATALDQLVQTHAEAHRAGGSLVLRNCSPRVDGLLALTGLRRVFTVRD